MKPIQSALKQWMRSNESFQSSLQEVKKEVLASSDVQQLLQQHPELTNEQVEKQLIKLYEYDVQSKACEKCASLDKCVNVIPGFVPHAIVENQRIRLSYHECPRKEKQIAQNEHRSLIKSLHMPKEIYEASFDKVDLTDPERKQALAQVRKFFVDSQNELPQKGLYLHGSFGVGKTYLLGALANELAQLKIDTYFIYMPEFVREIKASISDSTINEKIDRFKKASVLVLDDIGAEFLSPWFRDEVLGAILQYRMMERLPVFFTSNYDLDELKNNLARSGKGEYDELKAARIMERIRQVSQPIEVKGLNHRDL
ncbi:primosomal protein DnaI [Halalkalibacillus sediminis]|uniref:Primosomal protein DnaI n=1 Tax=Halalkalibacillus sediminis TaxID=2018042 RepID=A0A2I0QY43_9BACI|nr:primosomal protein DnaI [Halalkalibacillus sediminis]PKR79252.1 primosomal protein DnaI [Halalkalibacillus sediminis]